MTLLVLALKVLMVQLSTLVGAEKLQAAASGQKNFVSDFAHIRLGDTGKSYCQGVIMA